MGCRTDPGRCRRLVIAGVLAGLAALALGGCGQSARQKLVSAYRDRLAVATVDFFPTPTKLPEGLQTCMARGATRLPNRTLRSLGQGLAKAPPAARSAAAKLFTDCLTEPRVKQIDALLAKRVTLPQQSVARVGSCYRQQFAALPESQLAKVITAGALGGSAEKAESAALGQRVIVTCAQTPPVLDAVRQQFVAGVRSGFSGSGLPQAFKTCLLNAAQAITSAQAAQLLITGKSRAVSRAIARTCHPEVS